MTYGCIIEIGGNNGTEQVNVIGAANIKGKAHLDQKAFELLSQSQQSDKGM